jgi:DNA-binding helix-turn-helix protein
MDFKKLRETKFGKLTEFAVAVGENISTVSMWENEKSVPRTKTIPKIAEVLGVTTDEVIACFVK